MRIGVVLPAPLGPRKPRTSPFLTSKETSFNALVGPKFLDKWLAVIMAFYTKDIMIEL